MIIGVPKEIKSHEHRVGMAPGSVREAVNCGHTVLVETKAGDGIGFTDSDYAQVGAEILQTAKEIFKRAELIIKVKEPQAQECAMLQPGQVLFTYLHLAPDPHLTDLLLKSGCIAIAYETVTDNSGGLPLLAPMSQVAGSLAIQAGAHALEKTQGGRGVLLGGVPGVASGDVVILGGGVVGTNAIRMAIGLEANVTVIDKSLKRLQELDSQFGARLTTIFSTANSIEHHIKHADLVIGAVLIPGAAAPKLLTKAMLQTMRPGSVLVDVAIDQGGCFETSRPTTHATPTYVIDHIVHYCVANMPAAVPRTSTFALTNATLPFILALANKGYKQALCDDPNLCKGLNIHKGRLTYAAIAVEQKREYIKPEKALLEDTKTYA